MIRITRRTKFAALSLVSLGLFAGCKTKQTEAAAGAGGGAAAQGPPPSMPVSVTKAIQKDVPISGSWVGTLDGYVNAQVQPQVSGYLIRQNYREGSQVARGQVLFEIDPRPFQAVLDQAQGQVAQAKGQLAQAQAQQGLAQINVNRDTPLAAQRAIAQSQLDNDKQQAAQTEALVTSAKASIVSAQANVASAQLNLGFTHVRSLISGVAGQATTQVGNLVSPQSVLTAVSQLDPIKVYFSISDREYLSLTARAHQSGGDLLRNSADIPLHLSLATGGAYPYTGKIIFVDRQINQQTGAIRIAASFPNPNNTLRPGQFGRVTADSEVRHNAVLIPQVAVQEIQGMQQVFTVDAQNKVHVATVQLGPQVGNDWLINSGLAPGTTVVLDNLQKLKEGASVAPHPAPATSAPAPTSTVSTDAAGN